MLHEHLIPVTSPIAYPENIVVFGNKRITVLTPCLFRLEENDTTFNIFVAPRAVVKVNVFSDKGMYTEEQLCDFMALYGSEVERLTSKYLELRKEGNENV